MSALEKSFFAICAATLISGCTSLPVSREQANLMPESAAFKVTAKVFGQDWSLSPSFGRDVLCSSQETVNYSYSQIFRVMYFQTQKKIRVSAGENKWLPCGYGLAVQEGIDLQLAQDFLSAISVLGARVENLEIVR